MCVDPRPEVVPREHSQEGPHSGSVSSWHMEAGSLVTMQVQAAYLGKQIHSSVSLETPLDNSFSFPLKSCPHGFFKCRLLTVELPSPLAVAWKQ